MKNKKPLEIAGIIITAIILVFLAFFIFKNQATAPTENESTQVTETNQEISNNSQLANPASVNCKDLGGNLTIKTKADGGQYGLCEFGEGMACEEWALFRGDCPSGGADISGLVTEAQMYCLWLGGELDNVNINTCTLSDAKVCNIEELYEGICPANE